MRIFSKSARTTKNIFQNTIIGLALFFATSISVNAVDFTVNLATDLHDADTGDALCDIDLATAGFQCTLRAAVEQANALGSNDRVLFDLPANATISLTAERSRLTAAGH